MSVKRKLFSILRDPACQVHSYLSGNSVCACTMEPAAPAWTIEGKAGKWVLQNHLVLERIHTPLELMAKAYIAGYRAGSRT